MTEDKTGLGAASQSSATLGARLMARRKALGWSLEEVEAHLKMRRSTLQAIEGERYSELPDKVYALGFIKSYARFLGLDADEIVQQANRELSSLVPKKQTVRLDLPGPQEERSVGLWILLGVGLVVIIGGYVGWYHFSSHGRLASSILPSHLAGNVETPAASGSAVPTQAPASSTQPDGQVAEQQTVAPAQAPQAANTQETAPKADDVQKDVPDLPPAPEPVAPSSAPVMPSAEDSASVDGHATSDHPADLPAATEPSSTQEAVPAPVPEAVKPADTQQSTQTVPPAAPAQEAGDSVSILAREDSWVQVTDAAGKVQLIRVLKKGEVWQGAAGETYHVTSGNAGGVVFQAGNVVSAPLGLRGRVVRNLTVDAASVEQGHYGYGALATEAAPAPGTADKRSQ